MAVLNQGEIRQVGSPWEVYAKPADRFVAEFVGQMNFLEGTVMDRCTVRCQQELLVDINPISSHYQGQPVVMGARPEDLTLRTRPQNEQAVSQIWSGKVQSRKYVGNVIYYFVELDSGPCLMVQATSYVSHLTVGDRVGIEYSPNRLIVWEKDGHRIIPGQESRD
jgi:ABC-type Fe3+/spermidine/putrescine transport system ATPase subunit